MPRYAALQIPSPLDSLQKIRGLRALSLQGQRQELALSEEQRAAQEAAAIRQAVADSRGDVNVAIQKIQQINPLQAMNLQRFAIEHQRQARDVALENAARLEGQPAAEIPSDLVETPVRNLPARNLAAMASHAVPMAQSGTLADLSIGEPRETPALFTPAPRAQVQGGTHPEMTRVVRPVQIPGIPALGISGVTVHPRSAEDQIRNQVAAALRTAALTPQKTSPGERVTLNGQVIAEGGPTSSEFGQFQHAYAESLGAKDFAALTPTQKQGVFPAFAQARQDPALRALAIETRRATLGSEGLERTRQWQEYQDYVRQYNKTEDERPSRRETDPVTGRQFSVPMTPYRPPKSWDLWRAERSAATRTLPGLNAMDEQVIAASPATVNRPGAVPVPRRPPPPPMPAAPGPAGTQARPSSRIPSGPAADGTSLESRARALVQQIREKEASGQDATVERRQYAALKAQALGATR